MLAKLGRYNKTLAALVVGGLSWGADVVASPAKAITATEWLALGGVAAIAFGVNRIQNDAVPPTPPPAT